MKKIVYAILLIGLIGGGIGIYQYNKPHKKMTTATSDFTVSALDLFTEFESDENLSNEKYLDKVVGVSGTVQEVKEEDGVTSVTLNSGGMFGVICQLDQLTEHKRTTFAIGENVSFKGICTGLLMDVVLVRCVEVSL